MHFAFAAIFGSNRATDLAVEEDKNEIIYTLPESKHLQSFAARSKSAENGSL